jgi:hypothetical protein
LDVWRAVPIAAEREMEKEGESYKNDLFSTAFKSINSLMKRATKNPHNYSD